MFAKAFYIFLNKCLFGILKYKFYMEFYFQQGEGVPEIRKGACAHHVTDVEKFFKVNYSWIKSFSFMKLFIIYAIGWYSVSSSVCRHVTVWGKTVAVIMFNTYCNYQCLQ